MKELVPIKVKIGIKISGHADYPDWHLMPLAENEDPSTHMLYGWKYDKCCGHKEESEGSPYGMQWGMLLVTPKFASEALATFPGLVTKMTEQEAELFWDNKAHAYVSENHVNINELQALQLELNLRKELGLDTTEVKTRIAKAIDPEDDAVGLKKHKTKKFADAKSTLGFKIHTG